MKEKGKKSVLYVVGFMTFVCFIFSLGISIVYNSTFKILERNERLHRNKILCDAFMLDVKDGPKFYDVAVNENIEHIRFVNAGVSRDFYRLKRNGGNVVGFSFEGMGFWGNMTGILIFSKDLERIINIRFFEHKETPGLGARIEEKWFTDQFKEVKVKWNESNENRIAIRQTSGLRELDQIDAIAGATQTSMALERLLNEELERIRKLAHSEGLINRIDGR